MIFESLDPLLHFPGRVTVSMLVEPIPPAQAYQALRQERSSRYADRCYTGLITRSQQGRLSEPAAVAGLQSRALPRMEKELADLQAARRFPLPLYWAVGLPADDEDELDDAWFPTRWAEDGGTALDLGAGLPPGNLAARGSAEITPAFGDQLPKLARSGCPATTRRGGLVFDQQMVLFSTVKVLARYPKWPCFRSTNGLVFAWQKHPGTRAHRIGAG